MSVSLVVAGTSYTYPNVGDTNWGAQATLWAQAVSTSMLQTSGGTFFLTADVDFGSSFGLKSIYFLSRTASPAASGILRLANADGIGFRNVGNTADYLLKADADGFLQYNSIDLANISSAQTLTNKTIAAGSNTISGLVNANLSGSAAITNANLASMNKLTLKGNNTGGGSTPLDLTVTQINTMLGSLANPMTTLGDILYGGASGVATRLAGDTSNTRKFLRELSVTGTAAAPAWDTILTSDLNGAVALINGGTGTAAASANAAFNALSPATTKGDLIGFSTVNARVAVGTDSFGLVANSNATNGVDYEDLSSSAQLRNLGISVTASANILTIALKQADGATDPTTTAPVRAAMRSNTATSGAYINRNITAALSQTLTQGTTLGGATIAKDIFLWLIDSDGAGTMKLGASSVLYDEATLQTTVAESQTAAATSASPCVFTVVGNGFANNDSVQLTGTPPTNFTTGTKYFVNVLTANTFNLSATPGGSNINSLSTGSAIVVHYAGYKMVSDAAYTSKPARLIGKFNETFVTAGNWITPNSVAPRQLMPIREDISIRLTNSATAISGSLATIVWTNSNANGAFDTHNAAPDRTTIVVPVAGKYQMSNSMRANFTATTGDQALQLQVLVNGSAVDVFQVDVPAVLTAQGVGGGDVLNLNALDLVTVKLLSQSTGPSIASSATANYIALSKISPL